MRKTKKAKKTKRKSCLICEGPLSLEGTCAIRGCACPRVKLSISTIVRRLRKLRKVYGTDKGMPCYTLTWNIIGRLCDAAELSHGRRKS